MPLTLVATPIGHPKDITLRALEVLKSAEYVIGEEKKETTSFLKSLELLPKKLEWLNEHSSNEDLNELTNLCAKFDVALITDCGTPGFCDPGAQLVASCRKKNIAVTSAPGVASLTVFLSLLGIRLDQFFFRGFLPANSDERKSELEKLKSIATATILMDTPYRLGRLLADIKMVFPDQRLILGLNLTQKNEQVFDGCAEQAFEKFGQTKAEFILLLLLKTQKLKSTEGKSLKPNMVQSSRNNNFERPSANQSISQTKSQTGKPLNQPVKVKKRRSKLLKPYDIKKHKLKKV